jgi:hypothetical protein
MRMLPAREGQAEVIEPVIERHTGDADTVIAHVGEIGQPQPTRQMVLPEDNVSLRAALGDVGILYRSALYPISEDGAAIDHVLGAANYRPLYENEQLITPIVRTKWL